VTLVGTQHLELFVLSGILLNITPGQDTLYIAGHSVSQGRRAGLLSVLGIVCGSIVHTLAAAFGLSAILAFLPQFVAPESESRILSLLFLGGVFIFNGTLWCLFLVWSASAVSRRLRTRENAGLLFKRATGALFVGLGVRLAVSR
jgi:threonine/homoserine/homoserine lactone efflux protein